MFQTTNQLSLGLPDCIPIRKIKRGWEIPELNGALSGNTIYTLW